MTSLLLSLVALLAVVVAVLGVLVLLTVAPFVRAVDAGERRGLSPLRTGLAAATGCVVALLLVLTAVSGPRLLLVLAPVAAWAVPLGLGRLRDPAVLGRAGAHEG